MLHPGRAAGVLKVGDPAGVHASSTGLSLSIQCSILLLGCGCSSSRPSAATGTASESGDGLRTIDNASGGQVVYGPLLGESSLRGGMTLMLCTVHGHFGDRPKIGKFFQVRGSHSLATFFRVTAKKQDGERITGLVIVSMPSGMKPAAAVLFDRTDRFGTTEPLLMKQLGEAWKSQETSPQPEPEPAAGPARGGAVQPLRATTFPDRSGNVGLPEGWRITQAGGGTVHAAGPQGESIHFGVIIKGIHNPGNPKSQGMLSYLNRTHKPYFLCPSSADLVGAYQAISRQNHQR